LSANSNPAPSSSLGAIENWINVDVIQKLAHHTSTVIAALVLFWFVGFTVRRLMHDGIFKHAVLLVDEFVLLCLFVYFAYELFIYL
jgi:hypothetical protein